MQQKEASTIAKKTLNKAEKPRSLKELKMCVLFQCIIVHMTEISVEYVVWMIISVKKLPNYICIYDKKKRYFLRVFLHCVEKLIHCRTIIDQCNINKSRYFRRTNFLVMEYNVPEYYFEELLCRIT